MITINFIDNSHYSATKVNILIEEYDRLLEYYNDACYELQNRRLNHLHVETLAGNPNEISPLQRLRWEAELKEISDALREKIDDFITNFPLEIRNQGKVRSLLLRAIGILT